MTEIDVSGPPVEAPEDETEEATAQVLPFLRKETAPTPSTVAESEEEAKPGEWEADLPDTDDPEAEGLTEGAEVDPPKEAYPPSVAEWMEAKDKARLPVLPDWVKLPDQRKAVRKWAVRHYSTMVGYHAVRLPVVYTPKIVAYSPIGAWRWSTAIGRWVFDAEGKALRLASVVKEDAAEYLRLSHQRNDRVRLRGIVATLGTFVALSAALTLYVMAPSWLLMLAIAALTTALGAAGAPADRPLIDRAKVTFRKRKLSSDIVIRAHEVAGLTEKDMSVAFPARSAATATGGAWSSTCPTASTSRTRSRPTAASPPAWTSHRRNCSWTRTRRATAVSRTGSRTVTRSRSRRASRRCSGRHGWTLKPFPWGVDERGNPVMATMLWLSLLVGAVPRQGKTFSARTIALAAALDPHVRLYVFDGKASPDWRKFALVAHRIAFGIVPKNGFDPVAHLLASLRELKGDVEDRYHRLSELPLHICPEGKLTPEISRDKKLNMPLTLFVVDEVQEYLQHPEHGKEILALLVYLARVAPAVGVSVMTSTQKPDDKACPSELRDQHQARFALRVGAYQVSDTILGAGSYSEGLDASKLLKSHKGVGLLKGMSDDAGIVRTYFADGGDAKQILTRAVALREAEGTVTGDAAGQAPAAENAATVLDDVAQVLGKGETKVWSETIVDRLADLRPDVYGAWAGLEPKAKAEALTAALKPHGIGTEQISRRINGKVVNKRGIKRDDLAHAITQRNEKRDAG